MYPLRGREAELKRILAAWQDVVAGQVRYVRLAGEPGVGKTRLAQELYCQLAQHYDQPAAGFDSGYWPDVLKTGPAQDLLAPPPPERGQPRPPLPYLWWALNCRQGNESQTDSFQPYADGLDQLSAHLLPHLQGRLLREAWSDVAHGLLFGSLEYVPLIGPLLKGIYNPVRNLNTRLRKLREPLQLDEKLLNHQGGAAAAATLEEVYIQLLAALNNPRAQRFPHVPVCIVLDDAHWADARSIAFTQRLLELALERSWRLLVLASVRSNELEAQLERARALSQERATTAGELEQSFIRRAGAQCTVCIDLAPALEESAVRALLQDQLPQADAAALDVLCQRAGGHPYFAVNYARLVEEEGWIGPHGELLAGPDELSTLPAEVSAVIDRRLSLLEAKSRRVLNWGSVQGMRFVDTLVRQAAALLDAGPGDALVALDHLQRAHKLVEPLPPPPAGESMYQFAHRLVYERVAQEFTPGLQEYRLVRQALAGMLREHLERGELAQWAEAERGSALQLLFDYAQQRISGGIEAEREDWRAAWARAAAELLAHYDEREAHRRAEPVALQVWGMLQDAARQGGAGWPADSELALLPALCRVLDMRGHWDAWLVCAQRWLELSRTAGQDAAQAAALVSLAELHTKRGAYAEALELYRQVADIAHRLGDQAAEAETLAGLAGIHHCRAEYDAALKLYQQCQELCTSLGDERGVLEAQEGIADIHRVRVEIAAARPMYEALLAAYRRLGDEGSAARVLRCLAELHSLEDNEAAAASLLEECLALTRRLGDERAESEALRVLAVVLSHLQQLDRAAQLAARSLEIAQRLGDPAGQARSLHVSASLLLLQGTYEPAVDLLERSQQLFAQLGDQHQAWKTQHNFAMVLYHRGEDRRALELFVRTAQQFTDLGDAYHAANAWTSAGWVYLCLGRYAESLAASQQALALQPERNAQFNLALAKWLRGDADAHEEFRRSAEHYGPPTAADADDLDGLAQRGLAPPERFVQLKQDLGLAGTAAAPEAATGC